MLFRSVAAYATVPRERLDDADRRVLDAHPVDWVTVTSGIIAESTVRLFGDRMGSWKVASISPVTSRVLEGLGFPPDCEAERPTAQSLVAAIAAAESRPGARGPHDRSRA